MPNSEELNEAYGPDLRLKIKANRQGEAAQNFDVDLEKLEQRLSELSHEFKIHDSTPIFDQLAAEIHPVNVEKGFWAEPVMMDKYAAKLALVHSEVTEVLEALRKSQGADKVTEEFADIFIRCLDLYGTLVEAGEADPDLYAVMRKKMEDNKNRPPKHGNRWG